MHSFIFFLSLVALGFQRNIPETQKRYSNETSNLNWDVAHEKAIAFVAQLNLTEKVNLVTGGFGEGAACIGNIAPVERLGFRGLCFADGPAGVNRADLVSVFPSGITAAASWDHELIYRRGLALGTEFREKGVNVMLGPATGPMGRHPLGGRNWEGFGPDPYLAGIAIAATVQGVQQNGVQTCSKHYIANEQETQRSNTTVNGVNIDAISANVDDRTLHELYLWPFADAVKAGTASFMCSYNRVNATYACENPYLLNHILKEELGFRGYVVSDWFATHSTAPAANAGLDMEMPGNLASSSYEAPAMPSFFGDFLFGAVRNGSVLEARLNQMAARVLTPYFLLRQDVSYPTVDPSSFTAIAAHEFGLPQFLQLSGLPFTQVLEGRDVRADHATLIRKIGAEAMVLLKNTNNTLPLHAPKNVAIFGNDADGLTDQIGSHDGFGFDIGTLYIGGGSGTARVEDGISPLEAIKQRARHDGFRTKVITNNTAISAGEFQALYPIPDVCLVFLKSFQSEGVDRTSIELDFNSTAVVNNVASWCTNTIVITHSGSVNTMPWARNPNITAILAAHYPGEQSGNSIVDVLWGDEAPSGHLPYTIPETETDYGFPIVNLTGVTDPDGWHANFTEGQMIDYRHFDAHNITPLFEFGFGLTYTTFTMAADLTIRALSENPSATPDPSRTVEVGGHPDLWDYIIEVEVSISNTGSRAGSAVPQLYVSFPSSGVPKGSPVKSLRGFKKVTLEPEQSERVIFQLRRRDVSYWDVISQTWVLPSGEFTFRAGFSSRDLKAETTFAMRNS